MTAHLHQRGRASLQFTAAIGKAIGRYSRPAMQKLRTGPIVGIPLPKDLDDRACVILPLARAIPEFQIADLCREWYCANHGRIAIDAFEEAAEDLAPALDAAVAGPTTLDGSEGWVPPTYWSDHAIHRTEGGWDGHPYMGYVMAELVHGYLVRQIMGTDLSAQRRSVVAACAEVAPRRILEMGCGPGQYTAELAAAFPEAEISACDPSLRQLQEAQRRLNRAHRRVTLLRCSGEQTGLPDDSVDLVTSYAILHEMPRTAIAAAFKEAFRVLKPGGTLLFADVPPFNQLTPLLQWQLDYSAAREGEPFWRESATMDRSAALAEIGFAGVRAYALNPGEYPFPWIDRARKPG